MADPNTLLSGRRVVIADDEVFSLSIVTRMVRELGCTDILQADSGVSALRHLELHKNEVTLVVLDFNMPDTNGLQVLKLIRTGKAKVARDMLVIMLTGSSDFSLVGAAMALDVDAFVIKPVSKATLAGRLEKVFQEDRALKPAAAYEAVNIDAISSRLLSNKPVGTPRPKSEIKKSQPTGMKVRLEDVPVGAILADNVRGPDGELLIGRATMLTERLLRRLKELQMAISLEYLFIMPPNSDKAG